MRTAFVTERKYADRILGITAVSDCIGDVLPVRFNAKMRENRGEAAAFSAFPLPADGLERKNPLIVALGDSVTAGHFEFIMDPEERDRKIAEGTLSPFDPGEIVDVRESYTERFRDKLIDKYEVTSVGLINSGIAGDTVIGMERRLERDVISHSPDLVLINGALNWLPDCGDNTRYRKCLENIVSSIKKDTDADIVLITPNDALASPFDSPVSKLSERIEIIRETAAKEETCLVDVYRIWKEYEASGCPIEALLANKVNHPSKTGHEVYARALMRLFDSF